MSVALIAGASGMVGSKLLSLLLEDNNYTQVISLGRRNVSEDHPKGLFRNNLSFWLFLFSLLIVKILNRSYGYA